MATAAPELVGDRISLRAFHESDLPFLADLMTQPGVAAHWGRWDEAEFRTDARARDNFPYVIAERDSGRSIGYLQFWEETDPHYRHAGMDIALADDMQGRGLGPEALRLIAHYLLTERGHHRLTIDPAAANAPAIAAYTKLGFTPVGVLRQYEKGPDGTFHDCVLMDLLAGELREA